VLLVAQLAGAIVAGAVAIALHEVFPRPESLAWAALAGTCGALGLAALYRALAGGQMGIVAPISGVLAAAIPVAIGIASAGAPGPLRLGGFGIGLAAVVLVAAAGGGRASFRALALALAAGVALGGYNSAIARVDPGTTFVSLAASRTTAALVVMVLASVTRVPLRPTRSLIPPLVVVGCLDMGGNAAYIVAAQIGRLDVAAVLSSMYPVATVVLAALVLRERVTRLQLTGIAGAILAIALIAGG